MRRKWIVILLTAVMAFSLTACGGQNDGESEELNAQETMKQGTAVSIPPEEISSQLVYDHRLELAYAEEFSVDYFEDGYALISLSDSSQFLVVPEEKEAPSDLPETVTALQQPIKNTYLVASAVMDMYAALDAVDSLRFSALKADSWYVEAARKAMEKKELLYAGKYSAPDYELILSENCGLAIENTMIFHTPEVKEQLEKFGIPVIVDYSSYETTPQGRMEWVKLYGVLTGKEEKAAEVFDEQIKAIEEISVQGASGKTVAFFYITSNGSVNVRKSSDYLPKMIELAGGKYIFDNLGDKDNMVSSTMTMQMESFYDAAKDADYLIYNSTIEGELTSLEGFLGESSLLKNFKAVKEGHVYCTTENLYQSSMELGTMISDIYHMLNEEEQALTYLYKLE